ncbi:MAG TPA: phosphoenolpyruvate carboxykinase (ATP) [Dehalococcoidia bacterium]|nr:phosphoenolpyruvate carboxykinase (ATP) [Dehalococcoidia bacterium]
MGTSNRVAKELDLSEYGIKNVGNIYRNLSTSALYEEIVQRREGLIAHLGPIVVRTGHHTGRSPADKFVVEEPSSRDKIWWGGPNRPFARERFDLLYHRLLAYLQGKDIFVQDCYAGADPRYCVPIRVITEYAWHNLFARNMFIQIHDIEELNAHVPRFTVFAMPRFHATPDIDGTNSEAFIIVNFGKGIILIGGTSYAGEIKKAVFTVLNYLLPQDRVLSMHCAANLGAQDDVALFFGLSGTGKTSLSTDPERRLIGDDEHGWSADGIFNFEGGCYAKVIRLSREQEPQIYECTRRFGTILENVTIDTQTRRLDLDDASLTENTRACYPIPHIPNSVREGMASHPRNIFMLSYDAFGVMPPIALLTPEQAGYYFLQGYTAKVAETEVGLGKEAQVVFSPCFGAPFMALPPMQYATLLLQNIKRHKVRCWLVNTGLVGGGLTTGGERISLPFTRSLIRCAISGKLSQVPLEKHPVFGFLLPAACDGVPDEILRPANAWKDKAAYDSEVRRLAARLIENFRQFSTEAPREISQAGPAL